VASRLETKAVDAIYVTPSAQIGVTEQGSLPQKLTGAGRRVLLLGLGALPGMTQSQLRAILAHEYGHFSNRDTAGGDLARRVQISVLHLAHGLATTGQARWYNPAWLFVRAFHRLYLRITLGASRLQEILADRSAATAYGAAVFIRALRHIIHQELVFKATAANEIAMAQEQERELQNLYQLSPLQDEDKPKELETLEDEVMNRPTSPYDSHPAPCDRIELLTSLSPAGPGGDISPPAWKLLLHADALQAEMTARVQERM
jgi:Zn-dependent protease with chaperone function